jgi:hypothetical protein
MTLSAAFLSLASATFGSLWLVYFIQPSAYPIIFVGSSIPLQVSVIANLLYKNVSSLVLYSGGREFKSSDNHFFFVFSK